jgi:hypothetical protein
VLSRGQAFANLQSSTMPAMDPNLLWTLQAYANSAVNREWCTAWAAFRFPEQQKANAIDATTSIDARPDGSDPTSGGSAARGAVLSETITGTAARSGTFHRPLLDVGGKRYELKPSVRADASVPELLKKFSGGDTGRYVIKGRRDTVDGNSGIIIDSITPEPEPEPRPMPAVKEAAPGEAPPAASSTRVEVASSAVTVGDDRYTVYDYDDLKARNYSVVIPEGLETVLGLLVHGCYSGGDSRYDWKDCDHGRGGRVQRPSRPRCRSQHRAGQD